MLFNANQSFENKVNVIAFCLSKAPCHSMNVQAISARSIMLCYHLNLQHFSFTQMYPQADLCSCGCRGESVRTAFMLAQGGEFAFVLLSLASELKVLPEELNKLLIIVVVISMALTPGLASIGKYLADKNTDEDSVGTSTVGLGVMKAASKAASSVLKLECMEYSHSA